MTIAMIQYDSYLYNLQQTEGFFLTRRLGVVKSLEGSMIANTELKPSSSSDQYLTQEICVLMWNNMLPFFQQHLRLKVLNVFMHFLLMYRGIKATDSLIHNTVTLLIMFKVHGTLRSMATALKATTSPLSLLCMEVHYELALCEDQSKSIVTSRDELKAALHCDYGGLDKENNAATAPSTTSTTTSSDENKDIGLDRNRSLDHIMLPYLDLQEIRCLVYDTPSDVEGQALQWIQLAQESKFKPFITDMTTKALYLLLDQLNREEELRSSSVERPGAQRNAVGGIDYIGYLAGASIVVCSSSLSIPPSLSLSSSHSIPPSLSLPPILFLPFYSSLSLIISHLY
jgi:hypothetical protein